MNTPVGNEIEQSQNMACPKSGQPTQAQQPLVSVVMPSYNTSRYIAEAIDSVLDQDYPNIELIIVDDGSTDSTADIVRSYGNRVKLLVQANQGAAVARNAGIAAARGEFVAFIDSDDFWLPGKLQSQVRYLIEHPEIGVVFSRWEVWKPDAAGHFAQPEIATTRPQPDLTSGEQRVVPERSGWLYNRLLFSSILHTITVMARRSLIERVGSFDHDLKRGQDYDYWIRASRETEIHQLDEVLALYRVHGEGCNKKWPHTNYERLVVEKALRTWGLDGPTGEHTPAADIKRRLADTSFSFGYHHFWEGDPKLAMNAFALAAKQQPTNTATWRYLVMSAIKTALPRGVSFGSRTNARG